MNTILAVTIFISGIQCHRMGWPDAMYRRATTTIISGVQVGNVPVVGSSVTVPPGSASKGDPSKSGSSNSADPYPFTAEQKRQLNDFINRERSAIHDAELLNRQEHPDVAERILAPMLTQCPWASAMAPVLADSYFRQGKYQAAYDLLAPFTYAGADESLLLRSSLAAALTGKVYDDQRQFCVNYIVRFDGRVEDQAAALPQGNTARAVAVLSSLAIAVDAHGHGDIEDAAFYANRALQMDPGNPLAAWFVGDYERTKFDYAGAVKHLKGGLARAKNQLRLIPWLNDALRKAGG